MAYKHDEILCSHEKQCCRRIVDDPASIHNVEGGKVECKT